MAAIVTEAVILRAFDYGETSRILRMLTPDHGVQSVVARGARRPRGAFSSVLEPFARGAATLFIKPGRDLQNLSAFELIHRPRALGQDLLRFGGASLLAEITLRTASEEPQAAVFQTFVDAIDALESAPADRLERTVIARAWNLVSVLGFAPAVEACARCGKSFSDTDPARFDVVAGGLTCADCAGSVGAAVPPEARAALDAFCHADVPHVPRTEGHWRLLIRHLGHHVIEGPPLRSLPFLADLLELPAP